MFTIFLPEKLSKRQRIFFSLRLVLTHGFIKPGEIVIFIPTELGMVIACPS